MKNTIYTVAQGLVTALNTPIPMGTIVRRYGCGINASGAQIIITKPGYYDVDVSATISNDTGATVLPEVALYENGAPVLGAMFGVTIPTGETNTGSITSTVRVYCNANKILTVVPDVAGLSIDNMAVRVTEV